jgi:hypothetical protein
MYFYKQTTIYQIARRWHHIPEDRFNLFAVVTSKCTTKVGMSLAKGMISGRVRDFFKITVFWGVKPCSLADIYQSLGGIHSFHLQGFFYPEGDSAFLRNVGKYIPEYTASHPRIINRHSHCVENFKSHGKVSSLPPFPGWLWEFRELFPCDCICLLTSIYYQG